MGARDARAMMRSTVTHSMGPAFARATIIRRIALVKVYVRIAWTTQLVNIASCAPKDFMEMLRKAPQMTAYNAIALDLWFSMPLTYSTWNEAL